MKGILFVVLALVISTCSGQEKLDVKLIFDSKVKNEVVLSLKKADSLYFSNKYDWFPFKNFSIWCIDTNGVKYSYNYDTKTLTEINGIFPYDRKIRNPSDFFGKVGFNFYFDKGTIGWFTLSEELDKEIIRTVDIEMQTYKETSFNIPQGLREFQPIIISPDKLLYHNYVLNSDNTIDTLTVDEGVSFPHFDRVYMRNNNFMVDRYYGQENPSRRKDVNPIEYFKIERNRLMVQSIDPSSVKISNYRVEDNYSNIWFMSNKISPEKFLLYDADTQKAYPFELDKSIFRSQNLRLLDQQPDVENPFNVKFSYNTSMTEKNLYIYIIKNGIQIYKVSDYRQLMQ